MTVTADSGHSGTDRPEPTEILVIERQPEDKVAKQGCQIPKDTNVGNLGQKMAISPCTAIGFSRLPSRT